MTDWVVCDRCGALVANGVTHDYWHDQVDDLARSCHDHDDRD